MGIIARLALRTEVYFCVTKSRMQKILVILRPIGTHLKGIETCFQVVPLFFKSFHIWVSCITFNPLNPGHFYEFR
jgi:hypothetical protein